MFRVFVLLFLTVCFVINFLVSIVVAAALFSIRDDFAEKTDDLI